jgi:hypothetical protein
MQKFSSGQQIFPIAVFRFLAAPSGFSRFSRKSAENRNEKGRQTRRPSMEFLKVLRVDFWRPSR